MHGIAVHLDMVFSLLHIYKQPSFIIAKVCTKELYKA